jgi:hypothetical protein
MAIVEWLLAKFTGEAVKAGGEVAKTATEIPKNIMETRKAHLEVAELQRQREEREQLITPATFADVERYDPKVQYLAELSRRRRRLAKYGLVILLIALACTASVSRLAREINSAFKSIGITLSK